MIPQHVVVYVETKGVRRMYPMDVEHENIEEGIIASLNSRANNFEEMATENGWKNAYWTFE